MTGAIVQGAAGLLYTHMGNVKYANLLVTLTYVYCVWPLLPERTLYVCLSCVAMKAVATTDLILVLTCPW